jgi:hypothetical protein
VLLPEDEVMNLKYLLCRKLFQNLFGSIIFEVGQVGNYVTFDLGLIDLQF